MQLIRNIINHIDEIRIILHYHIENTFTLVYVLRIVCKIALFVYNTKQFCVESE